MPNLPDDVDSWGRSACYPQGSFYPLSDGISTCLLYTSTAEMREAARLLEFEHAAYLRDKIAKLKETL